MKYALLPFLLLGCHKTDKPPGTTGPTSGTTPGSFTILGDDDTLPAAALLSVWGTSKSDVWIVGADDGSGPVVFHFDGTAWERLDMSAYPGDLWWVRANDDTVWMSGAGGRVLQYTRATGDIVEHAAALAAYNMFGVYPFADDDVWAVGADITNNLDGVVVHYDGTAWSTSYDVPPGGSPREPYKVWGAATDDVWVVGTQTLVAHWDGTAWTDFPDLGYKTNTYFTVDGSASDRAMFVGGEGNAVVFEYDGSAWNDVTPPPTDFVPVMTGVSVTDTDAVICGAIGKVVWRDGTGWKADPRATGTTRSLHSCWIDDLGDVWAVGDADNLDKGVAIYGGEGVPALP